MNTAACRTSSWRASVAWLPSLIPRILPWEVAATEEGGWRWMFAPPVAFDGCCGTNVTITVLSTIVAPSNQCFRVYTRTWLATDCCTNAATCSQSITEVDTHPPVLTCAPDFTVQCNTPWSFTPPTAIDACCGT